MRNLFSTHTIPAKDKSRSLRERHSDLFGHVDLHDLADPQFRLELDVTQVATMSIYRIVTSHLKMHVTESGKGRIPANGDRLFLQIMTCGISENEQFGHRIRLQDHDMCIVDPLRERSSCFADACECLVIGLPRGVVERMLGPSRLYAGLKVQGDLPGACLVRSFFNDLIRIHESLESPAAERMAGIGVDLIIASIAERLAQDTPKPLQGTLLVQRAKAFIEAHLGDATLDPPKVAAAMGVSLRHLQQLFHTHDHQISDWIWQRRLDVAAERLADPGRIHLSIGTLSYGCGFANQAHFSRRFRDRFDVSPKDHRRMAMR